jgi:beta-glucosidase
MPTPELTDSALQPLVDRLTLEQKVALLTGQDSWSLRAVPEIGLRSIVMSDGPAGVRGTRWDERDPSVNFPSPTALAASWNRTRAGQVGHGLGSEARRKGVDVVLGPTINLQRSPYGGRHFEAFSEDPFLTAELATAYVRGVQAHGVGATVKHYVANDAETDRFTVDVRVGERALRELYLLAFEGPVVDGPAWLVMSSYNGVNGATASENALLTTPLQDEWGFDGVVVSDWTAVRSIESARHPQDLAMPGPDGAWGDRLVAAVRSGEVEEKDVDRKVVRLLRLAARVGALEGYGPSRTAAPATADELRGIARGTAVDGMVLLANDGVLPLAEPPRIALIGEGARVARTQGGGSATVVPESVVSPLEGLRRRWPEAEVTWSLGAVVQHGLAPLEPGTFTTPGGEPGLRVRYLDAGGRELGSEVRASASLVWFDGVAVATRATVVEIALRYTPPVAGAALPLAVAGLADVEVVADGRTVATLTLRTEPGDDPASAVLNPPWAPVTVPTAGTSVDLVLRFRPVPGGIPDSLALRVGTPPVDTDPQELIARAALTAAAADVAVVVVGTSNEVESEGFDRTTLRLPGHQDALVRAVAAANPRTVVVVNAGAPVLLPWRDEVAAVLAAWFPGQEFGDALADVLSGDAEPGGRTPVTWPATEDTVPVHVTTPDADGRLEYAEGIHIGDRAWRRAGVAPAYAFGHGLGYTRWRLSDLRASAVAVGTAGEVRVAVENVGDRAGTCVVQVYAERADSRVERPARWLVGFAVLELGPGAVASAAVELPWRRLAHWADGTWQLEPGEYRLVAGLASDDDACSTTVTAR